MAHNTQNIIKTLKFECKQELTERLIPFWDKLRDDEYGGFYGYVDSELAVDKKADKGLVLTSRILWFYSSCYSIIGGESNLSNARHAYEFVKNKCLDEKNGGVYWMMSHDGQVTDDRKYTYCQSFAIYALCAYYEASKDAEALELALELFDVVEKKCSDEISYGDSFSADFKLCLNDELSENGITAEKTMNTVLHLIEAYTVLYAASNRQDIAERVYFLLKLTKEKLFDEKDNKLFVFFTRDMRVLGDVHSYGHDIEAAWLIDRACKVLENEALIDEWRERGLLIAQNILETAFENDAVNNERCGSEIDKTRVWWVQAESVVGFINAYEQSGELRYLDAALRVWEYIKNVQIDKRPLSEWHDSVGFDGNPKTARMAGTWKCPYHNGRMCVEVLKREFKV
ncbi:MAG: AGE family epimerase/isomerase [Oscillospiraceae bacterium]|nr:AGE family epimerase/isomerase [Oscillospiraceae bacterium]